jgi:tripartite-type tricarboxylate transporter receptor subunit TctC
MNPIGSLSVVLLSAYDGAILLVAMNRFGDAMYPAITRRLFNLSCLAGGLSLTGGAGAQEARVTTLVVPYPAGALSDAIERAVQEPLRGHLQQTILIDNVSGVSGTVGAQKVLSAPADGQMLFQGSPNELILPPLALKSVKLRAEDFRVVHPIGESPFVLIARAGLPVKTADELIALARSQPDRPLTYGSTGIGSAYHLLTEQLANQNGVKFTHVPYRGGAPMVQDLIGGRLDFVITLYNSVIVGMTEKGQLNPLAVFGSQRHEQMKSMPAASETQALKGMPTSLWSAYMVPAKTPEAMVQKLHLALLKVASDTQVRALLEKLGMRAAQPMSLADSAKFYTAEIARYRALAASIHLQAE